MSAVILKGLTLPVRPNEKRTDQKDWSDPNLLQPEIPAGHNHALRLEHLTDLDLDCKEAVAAAARLIENTCAFGRPTGAGHYLFEIEGARPEKFKDVDNTMLLELRHGFEEYTVIPPSRVPRKDDPAIVDELTFACEAPPRRTTYDQLRSVACVLATIALVVRHWTKSGRHNGLLALAGFLARAGVNQTFTKATLEEITRQAEGQAWSECSSTVRDTYASLESNNPTTGGPELANWLGPEVVARLRQWFKVDDGRIEKTNERYAVLSIGNRMVVAEFATGQIVELWPFEEFRKKLVKEPAVGKAPFADYWLKHPRGRQHGRLVYAMPGSRERLRDGDYNGYQGFTADAVAGDWSKNREHIRQIICGGSDHIFAWVMNWLAALFQIPGRHAWSSIVMRGAPGVGKGHFADLMIGQSFHPQQYLHLVGANQLTAEFNEHFSGKVFVFGDETCWGGEKQAAEKLKGMITEDTILIHRKFLKAVEEPSALHILMASNSEWPVAVQKDDRRFLVLDVSEARKQDQGYFAALRDEMKNGGRAAMLYDLLALPIDESALRTPPDTEAKRDVKERTLSHEETFVQNWLANVDGTWTQRVVKSGLYNEYLRSLPRQVNQRSIMGFGKIFRKLGIDWRDCKIDALAGQGLVNGYWFPPLAACRVAFDRSLGTTSEWPADDDMVPGSEQPGSEPGQQTFEDVAR